MSSLVHKVWLLTGRRVPLPALDFNFLAGALDSRITFARAAGPATYFDSTGTLQTAGTNVARFDFDPVTHAARGLLIEETRTNLATNSDAINLWNLTDTVVTANSIASPDGTVNADLCTEGIVGNAVAGSNNPAVAANATVSGSLYIKQGNTTWLRFIVADTGPGYTNGVNVWVNIATGALGTVSVRGTATAVSASIQAVGNGWYRVAGMATLPVASVTAAIALATSAGDNNAVRVNNGTYYAWGGQTELGAFPTSYMPTGAASVTRPQDLASMPLAPVFPLSIVADAMLPQIIGANGSGMLLLDDGTGTNRLIMRVLAGGGSCSYVSSGSTTATATTSVPALNAPFRLGVTANPAAAAVSLNGGALVSAAGAAPVSTTALRLGQNAISLATTNGWLRRARYWPQALNATQLRQVTA